jgi:hypothetical protein
LGDDLGGDVVEHASHYAESRPSAHRGWPPVGDGIRGLRLGRTEASSTRPLSFWALANS